MTIHVSCEAHAHNRFQQRTVRNFTDGQSSPEMVAKEHGFEVGKYIRRKSDKCLGKIEHFQGNKVRISIEEGPLIAGKAELSVEVLLSGKWKPCEIKDKPEKVNFDSPVVSLEWQTQVIKAQIVQKLWEMEHNCQHVAANLTVQVKPKGVFTTAPFPKHQLKLVPASWKVDAVDIGNPTLKDKLGLCLGQWSLAPGADPKHVFYIQGVYIPEKDGNTDNSFLAPFWFVKSSSKAAEANLEFHPKVLKYDKENRHQQVPILRNIKALSADEELVCYIPAKDPEPEHLQILPAPSKRQRTKASAA